MPVPNWVLHPPKAPGKVYAVGAIGPSLYPEWGRRNAAEAARLALSQALSVRVQSVLIDIESSRGGHTVGNAGVVSVSSWASDMVVAGSQIVDYWVDVVGQVPGGEVGGNYALAVVDLVAAPAVQAVPPPAGLTPAQADTILGRAGEAP
jgi:hypothetical protein